MSDWQDLAARLAAAVQLSSPPIAIRFVSEPPTGVEPFSAPMPEPNEAGRTGRVPAGCVFWMRAQDASFSTMAEDHANCSVGSLTHGWISPEQAAANDDVQAVLAAGWVDEGAFASLPVVSERPAAIVYGPLSQASTCPDVVLLRANGFGLMTISDAVPDLRIEGKPQCHIVAIAKESEQVAASVGCALSRARTGMPPEEMTCAIPGSRLEKVIERLERAAEVDRRMARYARSDARRFRS